MQSIAPSLFKEGRWDDGTIQLSVPAIKDIDDLIISTETREPSTLQMMQSASLRFTANSSLVLSSCHVRGLYKVGLRDS